MKVANMKFHYVKEAINVTLFAVGQDEWRKEDTGKSMTNVLLHILRYAKRHHTQAEVMLSSKKIKPIALAVIVLH